MSDTVTVSDESTDSGGQEPGQHQPRDDPPAMLPGRLRALLRRLTALSAPRESGSTFDGVLSYAAEWHAFVIGFAVGYVRPDLAPTVVAYALGRGGARGSFQEDSHVKDVADEPAYALAGLSAGAALRGQSIGALVPAGVA